MYAAICERSSSRIVQRGLDFSGGQKTKRKRGISSTKQQKFLCTIRKAIYTRQTTLLLFSKIWEQFKEENIIIIKSNLISNSKNTCLMKTLSVIDSFAPIVTLVVTPHQTVSESVFQLYNYTTTIMPILSNLFYCNVKPCPSCASTFPPSPAMLPALQFNSSTGSPPSSDPRHPPNP